MEGKSAERDAWELLFCVDVVLKRSLSFGHTVCAFQNVFLCLHKSQTRLGIVKIYARRVSEDRW